MAESISIFTKGTSISARSKDVVKNLLKSAGLRKLSGPEAVEQNLLLGLKNISAVFKLDPSFSEIDKRVCVLKSFNGAYEILSQKGIEKLIIGPNFSAEEVLRLYKNFKSINYFLAASPQVKFTYEAYGVAPEKIAIWPVGINTHQFVDTSKQNKTADALIYFKRRRKEELEEVKKLLADLNLSYKVLEYGHYNQPQKLEALSACRFAVILDGTESQGMALQEIMSANLPTFVFDQIYLGDSKNELVKENLQVTSVPYWSDLCGMKVPTDMYRASKNAYIQIPEAKPKLKEFLHNLPNYQPRKFIEENLSLEKQAREFLNLFN